jgi:Glycosyl transferase family 11.
LPKKYYLKAIEIISKEVNNPYFIFLSDDPDYVRDCFEDIKPKYISNNPVGVDFALMTLCEYGVCSNSTFSWWGAYLSKNRKK